MGSTAKYPVYFQSLSNKSLSDSRQYRALQLQNELKVLLISDLETDRSAASFSVAVGKLTCSVGRLTFDFLASDQTPGNWSDPSGLPGLAHFTEHMLFLGTAKYPDKSGFDEFLSHYSGNSNAFTYHDHTTFLFSIAPDAFPEGLDRYYSTEREIRAVDSENSKNIPNDARRTSRVNQTTAKPGHPFKNFSTGNYESLMTLPKAASININDELNKFHATYYSSNITTVCVLGKETLDELEEIVVPLFSQVKNFEAEQTLLNESPFGENELQKRIDIVPIKDIRELRIGFPVNYLKEHYLAGAEHYLGHLIGHEGPGSIYSKLRRQGWITSLMAGGSCPGRRIAHFSITINLTIEGWKNLNSVIKSVFQYIKLLQESEPAQWIWNELRDIKDLEYRFQEKSDPIRIAQNYAQKLHDYPLNDILIAEHLITEYRPHLIKDILNTLTPQTCRILTNCKENESKPNLMTEEWYGVKYVMQQIPEALIEEWTNCGLDSDFVLPTENQCIPKDFELKPRDDTGIIPQLALNNPLCTVWFLQDNEFKLPKGSITVEFLSDQPQIEIANSICNSLLVDLIEDELNESLYAATISGFDYSITAISLGFQVQVSGFSDKLFALVTRIIETIFNFHLDSSRYDVLFEKYERKLKNWASNEPRVHASFYKNYLLLESGWTIQEKIDKLSEINFTVVENYYKEKFLHKFKTQWFVYGNFTKGEAISLITLNQDIFEKRGTKPADPSDYQLKRLVDLAEGSDFVFGSIHHTHKSSCALTYFNFGLLSLSQTVTVKLLHQIIDEPIYAKLRTEEQLGYIVGSWVESQRECIGLLVLVQSFYKPEYLESRIDKFMESMMVTLESMSEEEFETHKKSLAVKLSLKPKTLAARVNRVWAEITSRTYYFERREHELKALEEIKKSEVLALFETLVATSGIQKGRLGVHILSMVEDGKPNEERVGLAAIDNHRNWKKITDVPEWKSGQALLPLPEPYLKNLKI